jgi:hypothetical protein
MEANEMEPWAGDVRVNKRMMRVSTAWSCSPVADFDALVVRVHEHGLRVILVPNYTSDQHPWFVESRSSRHDLNAGGVSGAIRAPDGNP